MVDVQTVFLTAGWSDWSAEFKRRASVFDEIVPASEECWVSVGERQMQPNLFVTIERQTPTWNRTGWRVMRGSKPDRIRYERVWEGRDPSVDEVIDEIRSLLSAPKSAGITQQLQLES